MSEGQSTGEMAVEVTNQGVEVFKKPLLPAPHRKRKVLDEEAYVRVSALLVTRAHINRNSSVYYFFLDKSLVLKSILIS